MSDGPQTEDTMIAALLREREGLVQRGLKDRVAQVDEQLKIRGYKRTPAGKGKPPVGFTPAAAGDQTTAAEEQAQEQAPKGRSQQAPQQT